VQGASASVHGNADRVLEISAGGGGAKYDAWAQIFTYWIAHTVKPIILAAVNFGASVY